LAHIARDGLDERLATHRKVKEYAYTEPNGRQQVSRKWSHRYGCIRYADDFLVTAGTKEDIDAMVPTIERWFAERGLERKEGEH
jgi:RNA-directed DNA polymerase